MGKKYLETALYCYTNCLEKGKLFFLFIIPTKRRWIFPDYVKRMQSMIYQHPKNKNSLEIAAFTSQEEATDDI